MGYSKILNPGESPEQYHSSFNPVTGPSELPDIMSAEFKLGQLDSATASLKFMRDKTSARRTDDVISADEANAKYNMPSPFVDPVSDNEAKFIYDKFKERQALEEVIHNGRSTRGSSVMGFLSGVAGTALDPIEALMGYGIAGVARSTITRIAGKVFMRGTLRREFLESAIENVAGNLISEAAFVIPSQQLQQREVEISSNIGNAVAGGIFIPALVGSTKGILRKAFPNTKTDVIDIDNGVTKEGPPVSQDQIEAVVGYTEQKMKTDQVPALTATESEIIFRHADASIKADYETTVKRIEENNKRLEAETDPDKISQIEDSLLEDQNKINDLEAEMEQYRNKFGDEALVRSEVNDESLSRGFDPRAKLEMDAPETSLSYKDLNDELLTVDYAKLDDTGKLEVDKLVKDYDESFKLSDEIVKLAHGCVRGLVEGSLE